MYIIAPNRKVGKWGMLSYCLHMRSFLLPCLPWDTQEGPDVGGALGEGRAVDLCQTAKRSGGHHWLGHPCSPLDDEKGSKSGSCQCDSNRPCW